MAINAGSLRAFAKNAGAVIAIAISAGAVIAIAFRATAANFRPATYANPGLANSPHGIAIGTIAYNLWHL
jgi:hypothetical protein